jgi:hypothetical protein
MISTPITGNYIHTNTHAAAQIIQTKRLLTIMYGRMNNSPEAK